MDHFTISFLKDQTQIQLPSHAIDLPHVYPQTFSFCFNFHNIQAMWTNNVLTLNNVGPVTVTIPDGCYTIATINNFILTPAATDGKYYLLAPGSSGDHNDVY